MRHFHHAAVAAVVALAVAGAAPAFAQKSADTMRFPLVGAQRGIGAYFAAKREGNFIRHDVYEPLIGFDPESGRVVPVLAKSFQQVDPSTYEFVLRDDVKFHNGNKFDADDVVYIINFMADKTNPEAAQVFNQRRFTFIKEAVKLSPTKVRVTVRKPQQPDLLRLALLFSMYDAETLKQTTGVKYEGKPVGTGPYKVTSLDPNIGVTLERFDGFVPGPTRRDVHVRHVKALFMPDVDTRVASLLAGKLDLIRDATNDQVERLTSGGRFAATARDEYLMLYLQFDTANRSGFAPVQDVRVRRALMMAIDRQALTKVTPGGQYAQLMNSMCYRSMIGCDVDVHAPPGYDPEGARKLLAEAGYPNGFDIPLTAVPVTNAAAIAITGYWRRIGVKATVDNVTLGVIRKRRKDGNMPANVMYRPYSALPDASYMMDNFFYNSGRDFWRDEEINQWGKDGLATFDLEKRQAAYKKVLDKINDRAYMLPLVTMPTVFIHSKDVKVFPKHLRLVPAVGDLGWAD